MLRSLRLQRFKAFGDTGVLRLSPLTCLCGTNSSGKSSLLKALLLLKQTVATQGLQDDEPLLLNGPFVAFGEPRDIFHKGEQAEPLSIRLGFDVGSGEGEEGQSLGAVELCVGRNEADSTKLLLESVRVSLGPADAPEGQEWKFRHLSPGDAISLLVSQSPWSGRTWLCDYVGPQPVGEDHAKDVVAYVLNGFMPAATLRQVPRSEKTKQEIKDLLMLGLVSGKRNRRATDVDATLSTDFWALCEQVKVPKQIFDDALRGLPDRALANLKRRIADWSASLRSDDLTLQPGDVTRRLESVNRSLREFSSALYHVGPLREEPRAFYGRLGTADPLYVGQQGEATAFVLHYRKNHSTKFVPPPTGESLSFLRSPQPGGLKGAVELWMRYLEMTESVSVGVTGKLGLSITADPWTGGWRSDLTDLGVGVSQVLPVITQGLAARPGSVLLFEQPELHLHPLVQSRLCDFFVALVRAGRQVLFETHSDHAINRLRLHVALGNLKLDQDFSLYYLERRPRESMCVVQSIGLDRLGSPVDWPRGFCDEYHDGLSRILDAAVARRGTPSATEESTDGSSPR